MRVTEVTRLEGEKLFEALDTNNDTGIKTQDLVNIVDAHRANKWHRFENAGEFENFLDSLTGK